MSEKQGSDDTSRTAETATLLVIVALVTLYCYDAVKASTDILNLIFVIPVACLLVALCIAQLYKGYRLTNNSLKADGRLFNSWQVILSFAAYVACLPWAGFDAGTAVFVLFLLWLHGERRWLLLLGYPTGFAILVAAFFSKMLPYQLPLLFVSIDK